MARIFVMIYPWSKEHAAEIFKRLDACGRQVKNGVIPQLDEKSLRAQYAHNSHKSFFEGVIADFVRDGQQIPIAEYDGNLILFANMKETLRKEFRPNPPLGDKHFNDVMHTSRTEEEAARELELWKKYLQ